MAMLRLISRELEVEVSAAGQEISLAAWREGIRPEAGRFLLSIPNTEEVENLADALHRFDGVILEFPSFQDGRAYSQARVLRERMGFKGDIIARGEVLCDQALFMARSGFDVLDIGGGDVDGFKRALKSYTAFYQPAADGATPVRDQRNANRAAA